LDTNWLRQVVKIIVKGEPVPMGRPRFARNGRFVKTYTPTKSIAYKMLIKAGIRNQYHDEPVTGPLHVELNVYRSIQKSNSKKEHAKRLSGAHRPIVKPDIDNYFKAVTDACTGLLWVDDAQIVSTRSNKYYSDDPRVELTVTKIEEEK